MVGPETRETSKNGICLTQQMWHIHDGFTIKSESNQNVVFLSSKKGNHIRSYFVSLCMGFRIHRCIAAPQKCDKIKIPQFLNRLADFEDLSPFNHDLKAHK
jgi:hypothetical protein